MCSPPDKISSFGLSTKQYNVEFHIALSIIKHYFDHCVMLCIPSRSIVASIVVVSAQQKFKLLFFLTPFFPLLVK